MDIINLPQDLKLAPQAKLQLFNYRNEQNIQKTKVSLSQNVISFLRAGTKEVHGNDHSVQINQQHFLIMKSGNCLMTEKISESYKSYKSILLFFSNESVLDFLERHQLFNNKKRKSQSFYVFPYDAFIEHFVLGLEKMMLLPVATQQKILSSKFEEIMLYLSYQNHPAFLNGIIQQSDHKTSKLTTIVENNKFNKLSLDELAFLSNMSVSTFRREFFKIYQQSPIKWFNEKRLDHIALLLKTQHKRPIELYEEAGYENFSNFVQAFKKKFGMTPKQYQVNN
ncbi:MAG: AraC family transcriptional regulator [Bacteroidota bacterium]